MGVQKNSMPLSLQNKNKTESNGSFLGMVVLYVLPKFPVPATVLAGNRCPLLRVNWREFNEGTVTEGLVKLRDPTVQPPRPHIRQQLVLPRSLKGQREEQWYWDLQRAVGAGETWQAGSSWMAGINIPTSSPVLLLDLLLLPPIG